MALILKLRVFEGGKSRLISIKLMYDFLGEMVLYFIDTITNKEYNNDDYDDKEKVES
jgi:hypothetical protein